MTKPRKCPFPNTSQNVYCPYENISCSQCPEPEVRSERRNDGKTPESESNMQHKEELMNTLKEVLAWQESELQRLKTTKVKDLSPAQQVCYIEGHEWTLYYCARCGTPRRAHISLGC